MKKTLDLNRSALEIVDRAASSADELRIVVRRLDCGARVFDFGVLTPGGLAAGVELARISMGGLGDVSLSPGEFAGTPCPQVCVQTDYPVEACLMSQYAGWQIAVDDYFAMGSGPMRAVYAGEQLFAALDRSETSNQVIGVLETSALPDDAVARFIAEKCEVSVENVTLIAAPTSSQAGGLQVVSRSVETAMHKLHELGFDVTRIESGFGVAPLAPVAADDLTAVGRTNDAILYGGRVSLWLRGDDDSIRKIGPRVPASASDVYGRPFLEIFEAADRDFYAIDPHLFSPGEVVINNIDTGRVHRFGRLDHQVLATSFGL